MQAKQTTIIPKTKKSLVVFLFTNYEQNACKNESTRSVNLNRFFFRWNKVLVNVCDNLILSRKYLFFFHENLAETILGKHSTMEIQSIHLGGLFHAEEEIQMTSTITNFVGQMQGLVYNGHR